MAELEVKELEQVVVRFSGDSGDGMQLAGNIFSTVSATVGNGISTFPDYPADIRAPQGSLTGVSGFQVHIGAGKVYTPGDQCDVLVAMNAAAFKTQLRYAKPNATIIIDTDAFGPKDLEKADRVQDGRLPERAEHRPRPRHPVSADYDGEGLPGRYGHGQQGHPQVPQYVCPRSSLLALRPRPVIGGQLPEGEVRQEARHCRK